MTDLNLQQHKAVMHTHGAVLIIAGPGTGKTKTLTARIKHLINDKNVPPEQICALTFTKKAATEMRERLELTPNKDMPTITTFHGLGYDILTVGAGSEPAPTIISPSDQKDLLDDLLHHHFSKTMLQKTPLKDILQTISLIKSSQSTLHKKQSDLYKQLVNRYNATLQERNLLDYDDLLIKTHDLLQTHEQMKRFHHVLIDEFQDTSILQYQIARLITRDTNLFVIGDPNQSIYSFRGVTTDMFAHIKQDIPNITEIILSENYRSRKEIIQISSSLFPSLTELKPNRKEQGTISLVETMNEYTEAEWVVREISKSIGGTNLMQSSDYATDHTNNRFRFSDCAVIYRTHHTARVLEQTFIDSGIPYQMIGGKTLYDNQIVRFLISFFQYACLARIHNKPKEISQMDAIMIDHSLWNLLQSPVLRIPKKTLKIIRRTWQSSASLQQEQMDIQGPDNFPLRTVCYENEKLQSCLKQIDNLIEKARKKNLSDTARQIIVDFDLEQQFTKSSQTKRHIYQFLNSLVRFDGETNSLQAFLEYINYLEQHDYYDQRVDAVTLMTMHASKGLEFQSVFVCGFEDGIIPFTHKKSDHSHIEEEKRLLYVALTRAKDELQLIHTQERAGKPAQVSRFSDFFTPTKLTKQKDAAVEKIQKKRKKQQDKKAQMKMF